VQLLESIFLGIIQGLTEFIPISSSAHIYVAPQILGLNSPTSSFVLSVQIGTLLALLIFFRKKLKILLSSYLKILKGKKLKYVDKQNIKIINNVLLATLPALLFGILLNDAIENIYDNLLSNNEASYVYIAIPLIVIGVLFLFEKRLFKNKSIEMQDLSKARALAIGVLQSVAFIRGVSRSGITILAGQSLGLSRVAAAEFSFLMSIPIILITSIWGIYNALSKQINIDTSTLFAGILFSFLAGYWAIRYLIRYLKTKSLKVFGYYRIILGIALIILFLI
jgi:undecaprenyl-diphosphatase